MIDDEVTRWYYMQFDRDDGDYRSSDDLDLSFDFQEAEGDDRKARDED